MYIHTHIKHTSHIKYMYPGLVPPRDREGAVDDLGASKNKQLLYAIIIIYIYIYIYIEYDYYHHYVIIIVKL